MTGVKVLGKKAVFFDIDGTLYDFKQGVIDSTREAIKRIRENGHLTFICTGRSRVLIPQKEIIDMGFDGIIAACGTYIDNGKKIILNREIDQQIIYNTLDIMEDFQVVPVLEGHEYIYFDKEKFIGKAERFANVIDEFLKEKRKPIKGNEDNLKINKLSITARNQEELGEICKRLSFYYDPIFHRAASAELVPHGFTKAKGIELILESLGIDREDTYAFGDSNNDLEMLQYVQQGIAMGNSSEQVLKIADYVTDDINQGGIYKGLQYAGLL